MISFWCNFFNTHQLTMSTNTPSSLFIQGSNGFFLLYLQMKDVLPGELYFSVLHYAWRGLLAMSVKQYALNTLNAVLIQVQIT